MESQCCNVRVNACVHVCTSVVCVCPCVYSCVCACVCPMFDGISEIQSVGLYVIMYVGLFVYVCLSAPVTVRMFLGFYMSTLVRCLPGKILVYNQYLRLSSKGESLTI